MIERADLAALIDDPAAVPQDAIPDAIGLLEKLKAILWARLTATGSARAAIPDDAAPYTLAEAAALVRKSPAWLRRRASAGRVPGAQKVGRSWLFPRTRFDRLRGRGMVG